MTGALQRTVLAKNLSAEGENKMHDDSVARRLGFEGALVGGVNVYAYMTQLPVNHFGKAWLERGSGACRFLKPVYDGRETRCTGEVTEDGTLTLTAQMGDVVCATGQAALLDAAPTFTGPDIPAVAAPAESDRPKGSPESLREGTVLGVFAQTVSASDLEQYCDGVHEDLPLYRSEGLVHPGQLLHMGNRSLTSNVKISPWMHVGSSFQHFGLAHVDERLEARGGVTREYEHKGHKFVELDVEILAPAGRPVMTIHHTAIYQPRGSG